MDRRPLSRFSRLFRASRYALVGLPVCGALGWSVWAAEPTTLPPPHAEAPACVGAAKDAGGHDVVPLSLDTVFRLAEDQNLSVAQARARVDEAVAQEDLANHWLPDLYVGTAYYRHEGGIQLEDGPLIKSSTGAILSGVELHGVFDPRERTYLIVKAERATLQQKGELSRITSETLLDAATTYVDLLAAHQGKAISRELDADLQELLKRTEELAKEVPAARVEAARFRAEMEGRRQAMRRLDAQIAAASAKLVWLLGLNPCSQVMPMDGELVPFQLIDATQPTCELVARAQTQGPGIQELAGLVSLVEDAIHKAQGPGRFLPTFEARAVEGGFGAGPDANLKWDNRFDLAFQMRWNLADLAKRCDLRRAADAQRSQAHLAYQELRAKLTAGVQEAHETILAGGDIIESSRTQIRYSRDARKESRDRLDKAVEGSMTEVFNSLQSLGSAQLNYLSAVREYDKAQIRLLILLGYPAPPAPCAPAAAPSLTPADVGAAK